MIRIVALLLCLALPVRAEVAVVTSGEHDSYSRLLIALPAIGDWQLNRSAEGYALALPAARGYDLSRAFDRIPRDRVAALFADPRDGRLMVRVACACHAIAFRHDSRHLVVDIRDGPPPDRSAFELDLDGERLPRLAAVRRTLPNRPPAALAEPRGGYDWIAARQGATPAFATSVASVPPRPLPRRAPSATSDLRRALIASLSRGAASGVVGLTLPDSAAVAMPDGVALGKDAPGIFLRAGAAPAPARDAGGDTCPPSASLDLASWATDESYLDQIARHRATLVGEFDAPDPAAVTAAVRFYLHLGFGAEAADLLRAYPGTVEDATTLAAIANILDGGPAIDGDLAGWVTCDTSAALWATLAAQAEGGEAADPAVLRQAFSALPAHLRTLLAPRLAADAARRGDQALAAAVAAAAARGTPAAAFGADPAALLQAWRDGGPESLSSALAYVAAARAAGTEVPAEVSPALLSLALERADVQDREALERAGRLAAALAGDFATAFDDAELASEMPDLWTLLHERADDDSFLAIAIGQQSHFPSGRPDLARNIASRLVQLQLPDLALTWLPTAPPAGATADAATARMAARALIDLGRGEGALAWLDAASAPDSDLETKAATASLRAEAADLTGAYAMAAENWTAAGQPDRARRSALLGGARSDEGTPWMRISALAPAVAGDAPLRDMGELVATSARLRADIDELLADTQMPAAE